MLIYQPEQPRNKPQKPTKKKTTQKEKIVKPQMKDTQTTKHK